MKRATIRGMTATRENWRDARRNAEVTILDAVVAVRTAGIPRRCWIDVTKLSRFENGRSARIDPLALAVLARLYRCDLRDLDAMAADELDELSAGLDLVRSGAGQKIVSRLAHAA